MFHFIKLLNHDKINFFLKYNSCSFHLIKKKEEQISAKTNK